MLVAHAEPPGGRVRGAGGADELQGGAGAGRQGQDGQRPGGRRAGDPQGADALLARREGQGVGDLRPLRRRDQGRRRRLLVRGADRRRKQGRPQGPGGRTRRQGAGHGRTTWAGRDGCSPSCSPRTPRRPRRCGRSSARKSRPGAGGGHEGAARPARRQGRREGRRPTWPIRWKTVSKISLPRTRTKQRRAVAEAALAARTEALARSLLEKAGSAAALLRLGDLLADKKEWDKAAERYSQAWDKDHEQPLALYLSGWAMAQAGKDTEGKKRMEQSHWMPLGDGDVRLAFLREPVGARPARGAQREGELLLRLSVAGSFQAAEGMRQVGLEALDQQGVRRGRGRPGAVDAALPERQRQLRAAGGLPRRAGLRPPPAGRRIHGRRQDRRGEARGRPRPGGLARRRLLPDRAGSGLGKGRPQEGGGGIVRAVPGGPGKALRRVPQLRVGPQLGGVDLRLLPPQPGPRRGARPQGGGAGADQRRQPRHAGRGLLPARRKGQGGRRAEEGHRSGPEKAPISANSSSASRPAIPTPNGRRKRRTRSNVGAAADHRPARPGRDGGVRPAAGRAALSGGRRRPGRPARGRQDAPRPRRRRRPGRRRRPRRHQPDLRPHPGIRRPAARLPLRRLPPARRRRLYRSGSA